MRSHIFEAEQRYGTCEYLWRHETEQEADASAGLGEDVGADTPRSELDLDDTAGNADAAGAASAANAASAARQRYEPYASAPVAKYGHAGKGKKRGKSDKSKSGKSGKGSEPPVFIKDDSEPEAEQTKEVEPQVQAQAQTQAEAETAAAETAPEVYDAATMPIIAEVSRQAAASVLQQLMMQTSMQVQVPPMPMGPFVYPPVPPAPVQAMPMPPVPPASRTAPQVSFKQRGPAS